MVNIPSACVAGYEVPGGGFRMCAWRTNENDPLTGEWFLDVLIAKITDLGTAEAVATNLAAYCKHAREAEARAAAMFEGSGWCD